ncbi:MAG: hypothetical protein MI974_32975 [Chitinophagales bacterium]|nr:hypothetical protein [Chitinophagales bacterium]
MSRLGIMGGFCFDIWSHFLAIFYFSQKEFFGQIAVFSLLLNSQRRFIILNKIHMKSVHIYCKNIDPFEIYRLLKQENQKSIAFKLEEDSPDYVRGGDIDPAIIAAIINATAVTLAALIALIGIVVGKTTEKKSKEVRIEIKLTGDVLNSIKGASKDQLNQWINLLGQTDSQDRISLPLSSEYEKGNEYFELLDEILAEKVERIDIIEE